MQKSTSKSGMVDDFIDRKHGRARVAYPHPELEPILKPTYGIILYQEQVMQIAQVLAGYTLGGADLLRRAMGKKKPAEMAKQRAVFLDGAVRRGVASETATHIFDLMEKFAGYGFNKTVAIGTRIATIGGDKPIEQFRAGDWVVSVNRDGSLQRSLVVALHDHGKVPVWEVIFHDGSREICTLDHKWLTRQGQLPLWKVIQLGEQVWGTTSDQALGSCASEGVSSVYEYDPLGTQLGERANNASFVDGMLQDQWRVVEPRLRGIDLPDREWWMGRYIMLREPVRIRFVGWHQGYDLEVNHPEHNFLLASGLCCSNSHSAAYALVAYQTLWLKAHYPAAFMAAVLSADMDNTDKVVTLIDACREMKLKVEPPAINRSDYRFTVGDGTTVIYGIGAIKGVGESAIEAMLQACREGGPFKDIWDFCHRIDLHRANRRVLDALIRAGALDGLGENRATLTGQLPLALKLAEQHKETETAGQTDLFGTIDADAVAQPDSQLASRTWGEWDEEQRLQGEKETLGLYLTGHPIDRVAAELDAMTGARIGALLQSGRGSTDGDKCTVGGLVVGVRHGKTQRGRMGSVILDDGTGRIEVTCFSEVYEEARDLLVADNILVITGALSFDDYRDSWSLRAERVQTLEQARAELANHLALGLDLSDPDAHARGRALVGELPTILRTSSGTGLPVYVHYHRPGACGCLLMGKDWRVRPTDELLKRLRHLLGSKAVRVAYERVGFEGAVSGYQSPVANGSKPVRTADVNSP